MDLKQLSHRLIYDSNNLNTTDIYSQFRIMSPEYAPHEEEVKPYPVPETEHIFALFWDIHDGHALSATLLPTATPFTYRKNFVPGTRTQMHTHEYLELFYIIDGEYKQKILGKEFTFHKGELCLIDKNCRHQEILDGTSATILFMGFSNVMFEAIMNRGITTEGISSFLNTALLEQKSLHQYLYFRPLSDNLLPMEEVLLNLLQELLRHDEATPLICQGLLLRIFRLLSTQYDFSLSKKLQKKINWMLFEEITDYMNQHLKYMSIGMLAEEFHFQDDYFNRLIKSQTKLTYTEYLQRLRLKRAEYLLQHTALNIDQIAEEVGYHNKGYFYKIFTERYQLTPAQFRKKKLE